MRRFFLVLLYLPLFFILTWSQEPITLEQIWTERAFSARGAGQFNFLADGRQYTRLVRNQVVRFDVVTGKQTGVDFDPADSLRIRSYRWSADERFLLVETAVERIYRYSTRSTAYVWDTEERQLYPVSRKGKQMFPTFSPDGTQVAFVRDNNLFISDYQRGQEIQVTDDGVVNRIINGAPDWVYEEELKLVRAFEWSPDGTRLAFYRFDETAVPEFTLERYSGDLYPVRETFKYPKVGATNSTVEIRVYDLASGEIRQLDVGSEADQYIPRIKWTQDPNELCVFRLNRHQTDLELLLFDVTSGSVRSLLREQNQWYVSIHNNLTFLADGSHFLWSSEQDGWNHLYLYNMQGQLVRQLTRGDWEVTDFYGVDETNKG